MQQLLQVKDKESIIQRGSGCGSDGRDGRFRHQRSEVQIGIGIGQIYITHIQSSVVKIAKIKRLGMGHFFNIIDLDFRGTLL